MPTIVFPKGLNWFYPHQADLLAEDLRRRNVETAVVASGDIEALRQRRGDVLIISLGESVISAERGGKGDALLDCLKRFRRRVLLNYDSLATQYFRRHFAREGLLTEIIDVGVAPQTSLETVRGIPYRWVPESFTAAEIEAIEPWSAGRPLPWVMMGHSNPDRAALTAACVDAIHPGGFVFMPPVRPYDNETGLGRAQVHAVLRKAEFYVWGSHHGAPYHEGLRALHAVEAGAVPAKIDPLHYRVFAQVPWVYPSLSALSEARARPGAAELYRQAKAFLLANGTIADQILHRLELSGAEPQVVSRPSPSASALSGAAAR